jgi:predicted chitinase
MFATARHEAWHFLSAEYFSTKPEIGNLSYFDKYDPVRAATQDLRHRAIKNENMMEGDGYKYRGRGLVHLTWKTNYRKAKENFGINFVDFPEKAAEFEHSIPIMIWGMKTGIFTGHKLSNYINSSKIDYVSARKIINGTDQQDLIARYAEKFERILRETSTAKENF